MEYQRKKFVYKVATFLKATGDKAITLEKLLHQALKKHPKALDRAENPDGTEFRFLNYSGNHLIAESPQSIFGCEFLAFEQGADQSTIKIDPAAASVDVDAMLANKGEEFLAGARLPQIVRLALPCCLGHIRFRNRVSFPRSRFYSPNYTNENYIGKMQRGDNCAH